MALRIQQGTSWSVFLFCLKVPIHAPGTMNGQWCISFFFNLFVKHRTDSLKLLMFMSTSKNAVCVLYVFVVFIYLLVCLLCLCVFFPLPSHTATTAKNTHVDPILLRSLSMTSTLRKRSNTCNPVERKKCQSWISGGKKNQATN